MALQVSALAAEAGLMPDTIRYYERLGLLPKPARTASGYRQYDERSLYRLRFIKGAQSFGLKLSEIGELLDIQDKGACPCGHTREIVERRIEEIDAEIARLKSLRKDLFGMADLDCPATEESQFWRCEATFVSRGGEQSA